MICPNCGFKNIEGTDNCASCLTDLTAISGHSPKTKIERVLMSDPVSKLVVRKPITVTGDVSALQAVHQMTQEKIGTVLIVDALGDLEGILSEYDIVFKAMTAEKDLSKVSVQELMTPEPETLSSEASLAFAINMMAVGGFRHIPLVNLGSRKPIGIVSVRDVLRYLSKVFA